MHSIQRLPSGDIPPSRLPFKAETVSVLAEFRFGPHWEAGDKLTIEFCDNVLMMPGDVVLYEKEDGTRHFGEMVGYGAQNGSNQPTIWLSIDKEKGMERVQYAFVHPRQVIGRVVLSNKPSD